MSQFFFDPITHLATSWHLRLFLDLNIHSSEAIVIHAFIKVLPPKMVFKTNEPLCVLRHLEYAVVGSVAHVSWVLTIIIISLSSSLLKSIEWAQGGFKTFYLILMEVTS